MAERPAFKFFYQNVLCLTKVYKVLDEIKIMISEQNDIIVSILFSSPGQSPGKAIVLTPASALAAVASVLAKC